MLFHKLEIALNCFTILRSTTVYVRVLYCTITQNYLEMYQLLSYWAYMRHERSIVHQFSLLIYKSLQKNSRVNVVSQARNSIKLFHDVKGI